MSVQDIPADAQKRLKPDKSEFALSFLLRALHKSEIEVARDDCPLVYVDFPFRARDSSLMSFVVAVVAESGALASVIIVHGNRVCIDLFFIAIEFPKTEQNMVQLNDMMTFKVFGGATAQTGCSLVACDPVGIGFRQPDALFQSLENRSCVHTYTIRSKRKDFHLRNTGFSLTGIGRRIVKRGRIHGVLRGSVLGGVDNIYYEHLILEPDHHMRQ